MTILLGRGVLNRLTLKVLILAMNEMCQQNICCILATRIDRFVLRLCSTLATPRAKYSYVTYLPYALYF